MVAVNASALVEMSTSEGGCASGAARMWGGRLGTIAGFRFEPLCPVPIAVEVMASDGVGCGRQRFVTTRRMVWIH